MTTKQMLAGARRWFDISASAESDDAQVMIYDYIGWGGVEAKDFVARLHEIKASRITVSINTPGGDVFEGLSIYNALRSHGAHITTRVDGIAASIGSIIALAGDKVLMHEASFLMIHNAWGFVIGSAKDMREMAETLDKVSESLRDIYVKRTGKTASEVQKLMDDETWFTAQEAVDAKMADEILTGGGVQARVEFDLSSYSRVPAPLVASSSSESARVQEEGLRRAAIMRRRLALVERGGLSR
jgi:ATP-dependent Clp endopeptidase proteolytic subunit ClpP